MKRILKTVGIEGWLALWVTMAMLIFSSTPWMKLIVPQAYNMVNSSPIWGSFFNFIADSISSVWIIGPLLSWAVRLLFINNLPILMAFTFYIILNLVEAGYLTRNPYAISTAFLLDFAVLYFNQPFYGATVWAIQRDFPSLDPSLFRIEDAVSIFISMVSFELFCWVKNKAGGKAVNNRKGSSPRAVVPTMSNPSGPVYGPVPGQHRQGRPFHDPEF